MNYAGWIVLDKPEGMSSNKAMIKIRKLLNLKTGYVGTLDPFAQGVLPIAIGEACKFIPFVSDTQKEYVFTILFGAETDTLDRDGRIIRSGGRVPEQEDIQLVLPQFIGAIDQTPPLYSAIKINGVRACDLARRGYRNLEMQIRRIQIFDLELLEYGSGRVTLKCSCSRGTYIRSLARDICSKLDTYGHVVYLRRTKVNFVDNTKLVPIDILERMDYTAIQESYLLPCESALDDIPALTLARNDVLKLQHGLHISHSSSRAKDLGKDLYKIFQNDTGVFVGLAKAIDDYLVPARMCVY